MPSFTVRGYCHARQGATEKSSGRRPQEDLDTRQQERERLDRRLGDRQGELGAGAGTEGNTEDGEELHRNVEASGR